jgi:carbamate kinase
LRAGRDVGDRRESVLRIVVALGGNAMTAADGSARPEDQRRAIERAAEPLADLAVDGHELLLTHGNGPQVGNLLVKNELAAAVVPPVPLDWCGAQTQATIGVLMLDALDAALDRRGSSLRTAVLLSRTEVDANDPAFAEPSKPIGRYLPADQAAVMIQHGQQWQDRGEPGWRRVVASPQPLQCLDSAAALALLRAGYLVVCSGGGGVPVARTGDSLRGIEAVIDKDLTASLLAVTVAADVLIIATDVPGVMTGWGTDAARELGRTDPGQLRALAAAGEFAGGSMGPKVEAACRFTEQTGRPSVITSLERIGAAAILATGTVVLPAGGSTPPPTGVASVRTEGESVA